jgi:DNA-binding transcriptional regulator YdaS (Cro superfamily)
MEQMKTYIKLRTAFNHRELARLIDWSPSSFHQWLHGNRPIPKQKEYELESILIDYGYKGHN